MTHDANFDYRPLYLHPESGKTLPCDVAIPNGHIIARGAPMWMLLRGLEVARSWPETSRRFNPTGDWSEDDYRRARDCMLQILRDDAWTIDIGGEDIFDNAFQHAVGILSLAARHLPAQPQESLVSELADVAEAHFLPIEEAARFLLDRLQEFDPGDFQAERDFQGHVAPAIARLRSALSRPHAGGDK